MGAILPVSVLLYFVIVSFPFLALQTQGKAVHFARPGRLDQSDLAVRQFDARHTDIEMAFMLEEVQMPVTFDLRIVDRMHTLYAGIGKAATSNEIDVDGQTFLLGIEIDTLDIPRIGDAESSFKDLILH